MVGWAMGNEAFKFGWSNRKPERKVTKLKSKFSLTVAQGTTKLVLIATVRKRKTERYSKGPDKRGRIVADTLLLMMFLGRANARDTK